MKGGICLFCPRPILYTGTHYSEWPAGVSIVRRNDHFEHNVLTLERHLSLGTLSFCLFHYTLLDVIAFFFYLCSSFLRERPWQVRGSQTLNPDRVLKHLGKWTSCRFEWQKTTTTAATMWWRYEIKTSHIGQSNSPPTLVFPEDCRFTRKGDI